ncbi:hypothetical protein C2G38_2228411 [Gigaspora rosea]|uniref:Uncharacterized protein n=1 Tax=Gigaspora rosea TaxID=44941 RepID=A0A397TVS5_9GLOM|nr:hypothetical protein C2G38_2228411 [Gigaspora rosea]
MQKITKDLKRLERKNKKHKNLLNQASHHFEFTWYLFLDHQKEINNDKKEKIKEITNDEFEEFINYQYEQIYDQPTITETNQQKIVEKKDNFNSDYTNYLLDNQCNNYIYYTTNHSNENTFYSPNIDF